MYLNGLAHDGYAAGEDLIAPTTASSLITRFALDTGSPVSAQPTVAAGTVFWGSWDGDEHATTIFGKTPWSTFVGKTTGGPTCNPHEVGVEGTPTYAQLDIKGRERSVLFVAGGNHSAYALDAVTGAVIWRTSLGSLSADFVWDSPVLYNGNIYLGVASFGDCPLMRGDLFELNAATGAVRNVLYVAPKGCIGLGIWATPTIDVAAGTLYIATGNLGPCKEKEPLGEAMVEVRASNLAVMGHWSVPPNQRGADTDFGATPTLFSFQSHGKVIGMVGSLNKNGVYYAFRRGDVSAGPLWTAQIGSTLKANGTYIAPSSWNGQSFST